MTGRQGGTPSGRSLPLADTIYMTGEGVRPDAAEASKWTKRAADNGLGSAIGFIGAWYMDGNGVPRDRAKGVPYF